MLNPDLLKQRIEGQKAVHGAAEDNPGPVQPGKMSETTKKNEGTKSNITKLLSAFQKKE